MAKTFLAELPIELAATKRAVLKRIPLCESLNQITKPF